MLKFINTAWDSNKHCCKIVIDKNHSNQDDLEIFIPLEEDFLEGFGKLREIIQENKTYKKFIRRKLHQGYACFLDFRFFFLGACAKSLASTVF